MANNTRKKRNISYDPFNDKRKFYRIDVPIVVIIEGKAYKTADWSMKALRIEGYEGKLTPGDEIPAILEMKFQDFACRFDQAIRVTRLDSEEGWLVAEYANISPRIEEAFSFFSKGLISGEYQAFDEIIRHLDIPISEDYLLKTFQEEPETPRKPFFKSFKVLLSIIIGILMLVGGLNWLYLIFCVVHVDSAFIAGKTEIINNPSKGIIKEIFVTENELVEKDKLLFKTFNPEIQTEIEEKKNEILKNLAILREKQKQLANIRSKLENYRRDYSFKLKVQGQIISSISEKVDLLKDELDKKVSLYKRKLISQPEIDLLKKELLEQEQNLAAANYEYYHIYENIRDPESGTNDEIHKKEDSKNLQAEIDRIKEIINIDKQELAYIEALDGNNTVRAHFKAVISEVLAFNGKFVDENEPVLVLRDISGEKFIEAYLTEEEALKLKLGLMADINIPSRDIDLKGRLIKLERREQLPGRSIFVAVVQPENSDALKNINFETPAKVVFIRKKLFKSRYI